MQIGEDYDVGFDTITIQLLDIVSFFSILARYQKVLKTLCLLQLVIPLLKLCFLHIFVKLRLKVIAKHMKKGISDRSGIFTSVFPLFEEKHCLQNLDINTKS